MLAELRKNNVKVVARRHITDKEFETGKIFDKHYAYIRRYAVLTDPRDINLMGAEATAFGSSFGEAWTDAIARDAVLNMSGACTYFDLSADGVQRLWSSAAAVVTVKRGLVMAKVEAPCKEDGFRKRTFYLVNAFYFGLRNSFIFPGASCHCLVVEWDCNTLSYDDVVNDVIGSSDPHSASPFSVRGMIFNRWKELGLDAAPDRLNNGIYVSKSAFAGLIDRLLWVRGVTLESDFFAQQLIENGVPTKTIRLWALNPFVSKGNILEMTQLKDNEECIAVLTSIVKK